MPTPFTSRVRRTLEMRSVSVARSLAPRPAHLFTHSLIHPFPAPLSLFTSSLNGRFSRSAALFTAHCLLSNREINHGEREFPPLRGVIP
jgi:hypothetical protein